MYKTLLLLLACSLCTVSASASPLYGSAAIVVRDAVTSKPIEGCSVTVNYADPTETKREKTQVKGNSGLTDASGYVAPKAYVGNKTFSGLEAVEVEKVLVTAQKSGYQSFQGPVNAFFVAIRKGHRIFLFLDELHLAPEGASQQSQVVLQSFRPEARVEPAWGDMRTTYTVHFRTQTPAVLAHEFNTPILSVGLMRESKNASKPDLDLNDEGKAPDATKVDGVYSAKITPPQVSEPTVIETLAFVMRAKDIMHWTHPEEGPHYRWIETKDTMRGLSLYTRHNSVVAVVVTLPVRWVVAESAEAAEKRYRERFGSATPPALK